MINDISAKKESSNRFLFCGIGKCSYVVGCRQGITESREYYERLLLGGTIRIMNLTLKFHALRVKIQITHSVKGAVI